MRKNYGYDSYRGRSPLRSVLKWIIALLTAVLVLTVAALLWLQQFMVYSSEGGRLVFPWTEQNTPSASPSAEWESPGVSPTVVVVTPEAPAPEYLHAALLHQAPCFPFAGREARGNEQVEHGGLSVRHKRRVHNGGGSSAHRPAVPSPCSRRRRCPCQSRRSP